MNRPDCEPSTRVTRSRRKLGGLAAVAGISLALAACGSGSKSSASGSGSNGATTGGSASATTAPVSASNQANILETAFLQPEPASSLNPIVLAALDRAGGSYTPAQIAKAYACSKTSTCTIGSGKDTIAILDGNGADLWRVITHAAIALEAMSYPQIGTIIYDNANGSLQTMQADMHSLIARGVTGIVSYDDFGPSMTSTYAAAKAAGIPVAVFGGTPGKSAVGDVVTQVSSNYCSDGTNMAEATAKMIGTKGNVAYFTGTPGNPQGVGWQTCASQWFASHAPGIKVVNKSNTDWTDGGTFSAASALISSGTKVDAILYDYSNATVDIVKAYQRAHVPVPDQVTWTTDNELLGLWQAAQKTSNPWKLAYSSSINYEGNIALTALMDSLAKQTVPSTLSFPLPFVLAQNGQYQPAAPADAPGQELLPAALLKDLEG